MTQPSEKPPEIQARATTPAEMKTRRKTAAQRAVAARQARTSPAAQQPEADEGPEGSPLDDVQITAEETAESWAGAEAQPKPVAKPIVEAPEKDRDTSTPTSKIPTADDWQDFIARIVLTHLLEGYVALVLRDIELTDRELDSINLSRDDILTISAPFASFAAKNKWTRRHGREILAASDSFEAAIQLGMWMRRVQRIAKKHAPEKRHNKAVRQADRHIEQQERRRQENGSAMPQRPGRLYPVPDTGNGQNYAEAAMFPPASELDLEAIHKRMTANGSNGATSEEGIRKPSPPDFGAFTGNPGAG